MIISSSQCQKINLNVKLKIREAALKFLNSEKNQKSKIKHIKYSKLQPQKYLQSNLFNNNEVEILSRLRSRNLDVKSNFKSKFTFNNIQKLECPINGCSEIDDQQHLMKCNYILDTQEIKYIASRFKYENIFLGVRKQIKITKLYVSLIELRSKL